MRLPVLLLALLISLAGLASAIHAQTFPSKPLRIIVPFPPGGAADVTSRLLGEQMAKGLGQPVIAENRPGAGAVIGYELAARAPGDGHTLLVVFPSFVINPAVGPKTFQEMIAYAKANPGKLSYGSAGLGTSTHLRIEMLKFRAGIDILHVPYRGSADALNDLLANNVQMMNEINPMPHVKAGKLILLDISYPERHPDFPGVPTLFEVGYGEAYVPSWYSIWAPAGTPRSKRASRRAWPTSSRSARCWRWR